MSPPASKQCNMDERPRNQAHLSDPTGDDDASYTNHHQSTQSNSNLTKNEGHCSTSSKSTQCSDGFNDIPMPKPRSMSPNILEMLAKDKEDEDVEPPILLNVPQLPGPLAFSK